MINILLSVGAWIVKRLVWLILITAILFFGFLVKAQYTKLTDLNSRISSLSNAEVPTIDVSGQERDLMHFITAKAHDAREAGAKIKVAGVTAVDQEIARVEADIETKNLKILEMEKAARSDQLGLQELFPDPSKAIAESMKRHANRILDKSKLEAEIDVLKQYRAYLGKAREYAITERNYAITKAQCDELHKTNEESKVEVREIHSVTKNFDSAESLRALDSLTREGKLRDRQMQLNRQIIWNNSRYKTCTRDVNQAARVLGALDQATHFIFDSIRTDETVRRAADAAEGARKRVTNEVEIQKKALESKRNDYWLQKYFIDPVKPFFLMAFGLVVGAILVPPVIKALLYYVMVPIASKRRPICLLPGTDGAAYLAPLVPDRGTASGQASSVSLPGPIVPELEMLILPEYFRSATDACTTSARAVLNRRYLLMSLASGMYNLTEVRCSAAATVLISSGSDFLNELAVLDVPDGSAVTLRPSNLVGVIQSISSPMRISSDWRLGTLQSWVTLQLRYLVFHGPVRMIVKGCRGVRVENASAGRSIEQTSTIGFSANLNYSTSRTETFMAYLSGKKALCRDRFTGTQGVFIYEEMSNPAKKAGLTGRGIEGVSDAMLKLIGV